MSSANIMIIDPSGEFSLTAMKELMSQGYNVMTTSQCDKAIELMSAATPNLILLDGDIGYSPLEWLDIINRNNWPAQLMAAVDTPDLKQAMHWINNGVFCVLEKPLDDKYLLQMVEKALERRKEPQTLNYSAHYKRSQKLQKELSDFYQNLVGQISIRPLKRYIVESVKELTNASRVELQLAEGLDSPGYSINSIDGGICPEDKHIEAHDIDLLPAPLNYRLSFELSEGKRHLGELCIYFYERSQLHIKDKAVMIAISSAIAAALNATFKYNKAIAMASRDGLTGLYNRRIFNEVLKREFANAKRHNYQLSLLSLDLDHFKSVNDNFGHQTGDHVLKAVSRMITKASRATDTPARIGGEEFAVILPHTSQEQAHFVAQRLQNMLATTDIDLGGTIFKQTISQGIASMEHFMVKSPEDMLYLADQALYMAKREGRDTIRSANDLPMTPCMKDGPYAFQ